MTTADLERVGGDSGQCLHAHIVRATYDTQAGGSPVTASVYDVGMTVL